MTDRKFSTLMICIGAVTAMIVPFAIYVGVKPSPACIRAHVEINNVPEHTLDNGSVIPAERQETPVCDEVSNGKKLH